MGRLGNAQFRSGAGPTVGALLASMLVCACFGGNGSTSSVAPPPTPTANVATVTIDAGPSAAPGQINHPYVSLKVCQAGSQSCATVDHVLLDTGSIGLRLVGSVLAGLSLNLSPMLDAQGQTVEECVSFSGGQTWGPVVRADVTLASEQALNVPVQIMDDAVSHAPAPSTCGANGSLINDINGFGANGVLGIGVLAYDCGAACVSAAAPPAFYYGCTPAGVCSAENMALANQVSNVVANFAADNNGFMVKLPNLVNVNGDAIVEGELIFGLGTQADNALPSGLTVLGADASGRFGAAYNGSTTMLPALIDSGTDAYAFDDQSIPTCASGPFIGYYCPAPSPQTLFTVNTGSGSSAVSSTINFAVNDPSTFVAGATAFGGLAGGGGSTNFIWGLPFFFGKTVYFGIEQKAANPYMGPFYAY